MSDETTFLVIKAVEIWSRRPIAYTLLLTVYCAVVTYAFVANW
jgi:hypothetical protein